MSTREQEAVRVLDLLQDYYDRLNSPNDAQLRNAIDRVIRVFKSRLFQALLDIHDFYESILLDENKDRITQTNATNRLADNWENLPFTQKPPTLVDQDQPRNRDKPSVIDELVDNVPVTKPVRKDRKPTESPFSQVSPSTPKPIETDNKPKPGKTEVAVPVSDSSISYVDHWREYSVDLRRPLNGGLGFSIAGGRDMPCINSSPAVLITRITPGGIAHQENCLKQHDIIIKVNDVDFTNIDHQNAVNTLKHAGPDVHLIVRRLEPPSIEEIILTKEPDVNLGFSIAGGITREYVKGDYGIFVTNIIPGGTVEKDGRLKPGDRLMHVQAGNVDYDLRFIEHRHAVECIREACKQNAKIILIVAHVTHPGFEQTNGTISRTPVPLEDQITEERSATIRRGPEGFGFNMIDGDGKIFISSLKPDGAADRSKALREGDRILSINSVDLHGKSQEEAAEILKRCGDNARFVVVYQPDELQRIRALRYGNRPARSIDHSNDKGIFTRQKFHVRADFDYDASKDLTQPGGTGLSFRRGDILYVTNAADDNWWQAKLLRDDNTDEGELGTIPSKRRIEKREQAKQKRVNFNSEESIAKKKKKKFGLLNKTDKRDTQSSSESLNDLDNIDSVQSYTVVERHRVNYLRPVVIFGPFREVINDQLINEQHQNFASCVPHTSRPKRSNEVEGQNYHFVLSREEMQKDIDNGRFIEAGDYSGHLYGTSLDAVSDVTKSSKHCVLDVSGIAVKKLINAGLNPIVIYIQPPNLKWISDVMGENIDEADAQASFEKSKDTEQRFAELFTAVVEGKDLNQIYQQILEIIDLEQSRRIIWVPSRDRN